MNAIKYTASDPTALPLWVCAKSGHAFGDEKTAEACCAPDKCERCGKELPHLYTICGPCRTTMELEEAETVEGYEGPVYDYMGDRYFEGETLLADWYSGTEKRPEFAFCCDVDKWKGLDATDILEYALSDTYEDAFENVEDYEGLEAFLESWNARQHIVTWFPNNKKVRIRYDKIKTGNDSGGQGSSDG